MSQSGKQYQINVLVAFPYFDRKVREVMAEVPRGMINLIVDSGAFTAWNTGKPITVDDYCRFLDSISHLRPFDAVQMDVAYNATATFQNLLVMKRRGYNVRPCFQRGAPIEMLDDLYAHSDLVFLGGAGRGTKRTEFLEWVLANNKGRSLHWLAACNEVNVRRYKPYSCDSSTWMTGATFGLLKILNDRKGIASYGRPQVQGVLPDVHRNLVKLGFTGDEIARLRDARSFVVSGHVPGFKSLDQNPKNWAKYVSTVTYMARAFEWQRKQGTRYYFACGSRGDVEMLVAAHNQLTTRTTDYTASSEST